MTLEQYLRKEMSEGKIDFAFRARLSIDDRVVIYIHPANKNGDTTPDLIVDGNYIIDRK
jgi:hypothetical protein